MTIPTPPPRIPAAAALLALVLFSGLTLAAPPARDMGFAGVAQSTAEACPGLVKRDFPNATPQDTAEICGCMRDAVIASAQDYPSTPPTPQQWRELGLRVSKQCAEPFARKDTVRRCIGSTAWRQQLTQSAGISDAQFDRYCDCHVNLAFDEAAKGINTDAPEARQALQAQSQQQCLEPLRAENPAP
jgi:hypothetical protein